MPPVSDAYSLAIACGRKLQLAHFDVTNAFTHAELDDVDIWVEPPKGFDTERDKHGTFVLKLKKALYGTKQASRLWQQTLSEFLVSIGFVRSTSDPCLFLHESKEYGVLIVGVYVDDIILAHDGKGFDWFKLEFTKRFRSKHIGKLYWFLGIAIDQSENYVVSICQERYILNMVGKYIPDHKVNAIVRDHPKGDLFSALRLAQTADERALVAHLPYMNIVGALLYCGVMTRPEIAYHTSMLAKFMSDPTLECYELALALLLYLAHTPTIKITYDGSTRVPIVSGKTGFNPLRKVAKAISENGGFIAYSDSSWGNKVPYPMFGYCLYLFGGVDLRRGFQRRLPTNGALHCMITAPMRSQGG